MDFAAIGAIGVAAVLVGLVAHLLLSWMDRRGWIFYRSESSNPIGVRTAYAMMEFESLFNPPIEHVLEYRRHGDQWVEVSNPSGDV